MMKEIELIQKTIKRVPKGTPFSSRSLSGIAGYANVRQALSRLVKRGEIMRATRGLYVRPKETPYIGKTLPSSAEILKAISMQTGEVIAEHGAQAVHLLGLSTQVPMRSIFYTTGNTRTIKVGNSSILLKHITPSKLVQPGTMTCLVVLALWYLGKTFVNVEIIRKLHHRLEKKQFAELFKHTEHMPVWMAEAFYQYLREYAND